MFRPLLSLVLLTGLLLLNGCSSQTEQLTILVQSDTHGAPQAAFAFLRQNPHFDHAVKLHCGDVMQGSFAQYADSGKHALELMNKAGFDAWCPGNHDFEFGRANLERELASLVSPATLGANISEPNHLVRPYVLLERSGRKIAVIGLAECRVPYRIMDLPPWQFRSAATALGEAIAQLRPQRPDLYILLIHGGQNTPVEPDLSLYDLLRKYPEIDLVLGGHTHSIVPGKKLGRAFYAETRGQNYLQLDIRFPAGRPVQISSKNFAPPHEAPPAICPDRLPITPYPQAELTLQAMLYASKADVAFYIGSPKLRLVTDRAPEALFALYPYANNLYTVELTVSELRQIQKQLRLPSYRRAYWSDLPLDKDPVTLVLPDYELSGGGDPGSIWLKYHTHRLKNCHIRLLDAVEQYTAQLSATSNSPGPATQK